MYGGSRADSSRKSTLRRGSQVDLVPIKLESKKSDGYSEEDKIKSKPSTESITCGYKNCEEKGFSDRSGLSADQKGSLKALVRVSPRQQTKLSLERSKK